MFKHILLAYDETDASKKALEEVMKITKLSPDTQVTVLYISNEKVANESQEHYTPTHALADTSPGLDNQYMGNLSASPDHKVYENERSEIKTPTRYPSCFKKCKG